MKILVCGGRDFGDWELMKDVLGEYLHCDVRLIHGGARGADTMAGRLAKEAGWPVTVYPADWNRYGRSAGHRRNAEMLAKGSPDVVIAFPGGRGTADMVRRAKDAGVPVIEAGK